MWRWCSAPMTVLQGIARAVPPTLPSPRCTHADCVTVLLLSHLFIFPNMKRIMLIRRELKSFMYTPPWVKHTKDLSCAVHSAVNTSCLEGNVTSVNNEKKDEMAVNQRPFFHPYTLSLWAETYVIFAEFEQFPVWLVLSSILIPTTYQYQIPYDPVAKSFIPLRTIWTSFGLSIYVNHNNKQHDGAPGCLPETHTRTPKHVQYGVWAMPHLISIPLGQFFLNHCMFCRYVSPPTCSQARFSLSVLLRDMDESSRRYERMKPWSKNTATTPNTEGRKKQRTRVSK